MDNYGVLFERIGRGLAFARIWLESLWSILARRLRFIRHVIHFSLSMAMECLCLAWEFSPTTLYYGTYYVDGDISLF